MNIQDIDNPEEIPNKITEAIFAKQLELIHKYHPIEEKNGLLQTKDFPVDLNCRFGQARLKDMAWRVTEEICEAMECRDFDETHYTEELIDALHFQIELMLCAGYTPITIEYYHSIFDNTENYGPLDLVVYLGLAMNTCKNKAWKQTQMLTDTKKLFQCLESAWRRMCFVLFGQGFTPEDIYCLYFKKNAVNAFRQRSRY